MVVEGFLDCVVSCDSIHMNLEGKFSDGWKTILFCHIVERSRSSFKWLRYENDTWDAWEVGYIFKDRDFEYIVRNIKFDSMNTWTRGLFVLQNYTPVKSNVARIWLQDHMVQTSRHREDWSWCDCIFWSVLFVFSIKEYQFCSVSLKEYQCNIVLVVFGIKEHQFWSDMLPRLGC